MRTLSYACLWLSALIAPFMATATGNLVTYPAGNTSELLPASDYYEVEVRQGEVSRSLIVYMSRSNGGATNNRNRPVANDSISWANFSMGAPVEVTVTLRTNLPGDTSGPVTVLPTRKHVSVQRRSEREISFTLFEPGQYSVEMGAQGYKNGLLLFADPLEQDVPEPTAAGVYSCAPCTLEGLNGISKDYHTVRFEPVAHHIGNWYPKGHVKNIYLAGGAVVHGAIHFNDAANNGSRVYGRGHLDGRMFGEGSERSTKFHMVEASGDTRDITVEGIIISQPSAFAVRLLGKNNDIHWVKTPGGWRFNNDGLVGYENTRISNSFVWANDDAIKLYRDHQQIDNLVIWHLTNGGSFQWAWTTIDTQDVEVRNVDILHGEWPHDGRNQGVFNLRGSALRGQVKVQKDYLFENIVIENPIKVFVNLQPNDVPHIIKNVTFRNIEFKAGKDVVNRIVGFSEEAKITDILFDNVRMNGECLTAETARTLANFEFRHTERIEFRCPQGVRKVSGYGYDNLIELHNNSTRVHIAPDFGAKLVSYALNNVELLQQEPGEYGWQLQPEKLASGEQAPPFNGGGRFDVGDTRNHPDRARLIYGAWQPQILGDRHVRLVSSYDPQRGLRLTREYQLDEQGSGLTIRFSMRNESAAEQTAHFWSRPLAQGGGIFVKALKKGHLFDGGVVVRDHAGNISTLPRDPNILRSDDYLVVKGQPPFFKFGFDSLAPEHYYWTPNGLMFSGSYPVFADGNYVMPAEGRYSLYYNTNFKGRSVAELEPLSPAYTLAPAESAEFFERWELQSLPFPGTAESLSLNEILTQMGLVSQEKNT
ncbi:hypothetical protein DXV75_02595 [Alteromonas aestuariivivens]|uniref:Dextranase n=1 Tax=Alteromonas aestuariivivens TaxID=1938339 RepID=A0A3D8MEU8_9ALTE|nr:hypothetical protein [Alteromonas aestuariivivens]RDV29355.1 hypothetical protein DXV75_02595 [Alteromonas aestuariivivens]